MKYLIHLLGILFIFTACEDEVSFDAEEQKSRDDLIITEFLTDFGVFNDYDRTSTGLYYTLLEQDEEIGEAFPQLGETVFVDYTGWVIYGNVFDTSKYRDEPFEFRVGAGFNDGNQAILGLDEGVRLMKVGQTMRFYIPSHLAYGQSGQLPAIPPNSVLVFDIKLLDVQPFTDEG